MLEHDVDVTADELADLLAEPQPLLRVLLGVVLPEPVALGAPVDDVLAPHLAQQLGALVRRHDAHGHAPPPLSTYCTAYAPMPPVAPHTSTAWPCVIWAPLGDTIMR
ncbi:MAG: hypothetical protein KatS3mg010_1850 [Acidimicrobiia bacterium]|nr:MAG: hypothetical protein KatS3mg010_1850 [Acidimicrobiia bacterium]